MRPGPESERPEQAGSGKLESKVALIAGGDSGIGRAVAIAYAKEGADISIVYLDEHSDATETARVFDDAPTKGANRGLHAPALAGARQMLHPNGGEIVNGWAP